jgi:hypothetical protein
MFTKYREVNLDRCLMIGIDGARAEVILPVAKDKK